MELFLCGIRAPASTLVTTTSARVLLRASAHWPNSDHPQDRTHHGEPARHREGADSRYPLTGIPHVVLYGYRSNQAAMEGTTDRKSTRLNSSHSQISYA